MIHTVLYVIYLYSFYCVYIVWAVQTLLQDMERRLGERVAGQADSRLEKALEDRRETDTQILELKKNIDNLELREGGSIRDLVVKHNLHEGYIRELKGVLDDLSSVELRNLSIQGLFVVFPAF